MPESRRLALITGGSVGLGRDLAALFAADGYDLLLIARNQKQLETVAADLSSKHAINAEVLAKDLSSPTAAQEIFDHVQGKSLKIDALVNNAGFGTNGAFAEADLASQLSMLQVNIVALTHLTRLFLPGMVERRSGKVLNVASTAAFLPGPFMAVYYASKAFVLSFSEAVNSELAGTGVTVTALCPGPTRTEFFDRAGMGSSPLFHANMMDGPTVVRIGYRAMQRGKPVAIAGFKNRVLIGMMRLTPRSVVTSIAKKLNRTRTPAGG